MFRVFCIFIIWVVTLGCSSFVWALDSITPLTSSTGSVGANGSRVIFSPLESGLTRYINTNGDATTIGNAFGGHYIDTVYGPFSLDWSNNSLKNARIIGSTPRCAQGFGYMLGGFVRSTGGPSSSTSLFGYLPLSNGRDEVYYCPSDGRLHGRTYASHIGYVNFEGLSIARSNTLYSAQIALTSNIAINNTSSILKNLFSQSSGDLFNLSTMSEVLKGDTDLGGDENRSDAIVAQFIPQKIIGGQYYATKFGEFRDYTPGREEFFYIYK